MRKREQFLIKLYRLEKPKSAGDYERFTHPVSWLTFSYCNDFLAACSWDFSAKIWSINRANATLVRKLNGHRDIINAWRFLIGTSFLEPVLVTGSSDRTLKFWKANTTVSLNCASACLCMDALILDGIIATGHLDGSVRIWSGKQHSLVYRFANLHEDVVNSVWINPATYTVTSVAKDHSIKLWDYKEHEVLDHIWPDDYINIKHSSESISCGAYSQHIVIASSNGKILIYALENKREESDKNKSKVKAATRSRSMGSYKDFQNAIFEQNCLRFKEVKVIDTKSKK